MLNHSISTQLNQLDLFGLSPIKNAALAEQAPKPVVKPKDPEHLFKIISRMELMPDGSRKHYDGTGRLCLHSHVPEPKNYAYRTDNTGTTNRANSSTRSALEQTSHQVHEICQWWPRLHGKQWSKMEDHLDYLHKMGVAVGKRELAEEYLFLQGIARQHRISESGYAHGEERNRHIRQKITALTTGAMSQELSVAEKYCAYCSKWVSTESAGLLGFALTPCCNRSWDCGRASHD